MSTTVLSSQEEVRPISSSQLAGYLLQNSNEILVVDERPRSSYKESHIRGAINLFCSPLMLRKVQRSREGTFKTFLNETIRQRVEQMKISTVIFYRENNKAANYERRIRILKKILPPVASERRCRFLDGGYEKFAKKFPLLTESCKQETKEATHLGLDLSNARLLQEPDPTDRQCDEARSDPVEILPFLYLGTADHAADKKRLKCLGISSVMNVSTSCSTYHQDEFEQKRIPVRDSDTENISRYFDDAVSFIEHVRCRNGKVLVHCRAGVSRSATICLAYLIYYLKMTFDEAYDYVKQRRSIISPNFNFLGQLLAFEAKITGITSGFESPKTPAGVKHLAHDKQNQFFLPVPQSPSCFPNKVETGFNWRDL